MSIRKNTLINLAGAILPMAVMLVTIPLYLKVIGEERYGVLALVWLVLGYFSVLEMGLGKATANQIAKAHDAPAQERSEIFWTALLVNAAMGVVGAGILWLVGDYLINSVLKMPEDFRQEAVAALPWMIATLPLAMVSSVLNGALEGRNRFLAVNLLQITSNTIFQIVPLGVAYWLSPSLAWVIPAAVVSRATMNIFFFLACYQYLPLVTKPRVSRGRLRTLFSYSGWVAISGVAGPLLDTIERFVIGAVLGASAVTHYTIPMQLACKIKVLPASLARSLFPVFSARTGADSHDLAIRSTKMVSSIIAMAVIVAMLALRPFLEVWIGKELADIAAPIGELILVGVWANSVAHIPYFYLQATGRPDLVAKLHAAELVPYVLLVWLATSEFGLMGVAAIWSIRCVVEAIILLAMAGLFKKSLAYVAAGFMGVIAAGVALDAVPILGLTWRIAILLICLALALIYARRFNMFKP